MQAPIVKIYTNPFSNKDKSIHQLEPGTRVIDFLQEHFKNGFTRPTSVVLNSSILDVSTFDVVLQEGDILEVNIQPLALLAAVAIFTVLIGGAVSAALKMAEPNFVIPEPTDVSSNRQPNSSNTYNFQKQRNTARLNEPIPSAYGKLKWFPDLAAQPYLVYVGNELQINYLFSLGQGEFEIDDLNIGDVSLINDSAVSFILYDPSDQMVAFHDNTITLQDIENVQVRSPGAIAQSDISASMDKGAKTITMDPSNSFDTIFEVGDSVIVLSGTGDYDLTTTITGLTSSVMTLNTVTSWPAGTGSDQIIIGPSSEATINPYYDAAIPGNLTIQAKYFFEGSYSGFIDIVNIRQEPLILEIDVEWPNGLSVDATGNLFNVSSYIVPVDSGGTQIDRYIKYDNMELVLDTGNTYEVADPVWANWINNTDITGLGLVFHTSDNATETITTTAQYDLTFTENDVLIDVSDISSIDYVNGKVTFNTSKAGTIKAQLILQTDSLATTQTFSASAEQQVNPKRDSFSSNIFQQDRASFPAFTARVNIEERYKIVIYHTGYYIGSLIPTLEDNGYIRRIKLQRPVIQYYPPMSMLALTINTKAEKNYPRDNKVSVTSTRKLLIWNGSAWTGPTATRSISWALADVWMSTYGASKSDNNLDTAKLLELDTLFASRGDTFDGVFDNSITVWEGLNRIGRVGRTAPIFDGSTLTFVRDGLQTLYTAAYSPANMLKGSFSIQYSFDDSQSPDGIILNYTDEDANYSAAIVNSNSVMSKGKEVNFFGCVNYEQAWRESQYLEAQLKRQKTIISFSTEMVGHIPFYGDLVSVQYDLPDWGQGGVVVNKVGTTITTQEILDFSGSAPFNMAFMRPNGSMSGPHVVTQGGDDYTAILDVDVTDFTFITVLDTKNRTMYQFGPSTNWNKSCIITKVSPRSNNQTVNITCVPYIEAVYTADDGTVPDKTIVEASPVPIPEKIGGLTLTNAAGSGIVIVNWNPALNVNNYKVQDSTDNITWNDVSTPSVTTETINATGTLYVRVAGVITPTIGDYTRQSIVAS